MGLTKQIKRKMGEAFQDYRMIEEGDKILVAVSGGKDSLSLLHLLRQNAVHAPVHYSLNPEMNVHKAYLPKPICRKKEAGSKERSQGVE